MLHSATLQTEWNSEYVRSLLYFRLLCVIDRFLKLVGVKPQQTTTGMSSGVFVLIYTVFFCKITNYNIYSIINTVLYLCLQCFDAVGWAAGRASGL